MNRKSQRILPLLFTFFVILSLFPNVVQAEALDVTAWYGDGSATEFNIGTAAELAHFAYLVNGGDNFAEKTVKLTANIDLSGYLSWVPIGTYSDYRSFNGIFDGNSKVVSGLTITETTGIRSQGLFGYVTNGKIMNLGLSDVNIYATGMRVGSIVGQASNSAITNCYVNSGHITATSTHVGGIVGIGSNLSVTNCYSTLAILGDRYVGGIVGYLDPATGLIDNCYTTGNVSATSNNVGGIAGYSARATISNSVALNETITGLYPFARIASYSGNYPPIIADCYAWSDMLVNDSKLASVTQFDGISKSAEEILGTEIWAKFDTDYWAVTTNKPPILKSFAAEGQIESYPACFNGNNNSGGDEKKEDSTIWYGDGSASEFYIGSPEELAYFAELVNNATKNITFSGKTVNLTSDIDLSNYANWIPIGIQRPFEGDFDGNGFLISNMVINRPDSTGDGLFAAVSGSIRNLGVVKASVFNGGNAGIIVSDSKGDIENCFTSGTVSGRNYVGGICGIAYGSIKNCYSTAYVINSDVSVSETTSSSGGIVGCLYSKEDVDNEYMYSTGVINIYNRASGGGISGYQSEGKRTLQNVVALNQSIPATLMRVVLAHNSSTIEKNYAWDGMTVGGLIVENSRNHGTGINGSIIYSGEVWGEGYAGFPADVWNIEEGRLPILLAFINRISDLEKGSDEYNAAIDLLGVAIPEYILADLAEESTATALTGDVSLVEGDDGEYTVSVTNAPNAQVINLLLQVDGDFLTTKKITGLNGFEVLGEEPTWVESESAWRIILVNLSDTAIGADEIEVCKIVLTASGEIGVTIVKLTTATLTGKIGDGSSFFFDTIITSGEVEVEIAKYYSPYDTNRDGAINQLDLNDAVSYYRATSDSANWSIAQYSDINGDGVITVVDLLLIAANIVW